MMSQCLGLISNNTLNLFNIHVETGMHDTDKSDIGFLRQKKSRAVLMEYVVTTGTCNLKKVRQIKPALCQSDQRKRST